MSVVIGLVLACSQPQVHPKTGDVVHEATGCNPADRPAVDGAKPEPAPAPEAPPVSAKQESAPKREQPCPEGERPRTPDRTIASA